MASSKSHAEAAEAEATSTTEVAPTSTSRPRRRPSTASSSSLSSRHLLLLLAFLDTVCTRVGISQGFNNQAFIQTDNELRYLMDSGSPNVPVASQGQPPSSAEIIAEEHSRKLSGSAPKNEGGGGGGGGGDGSITVLGSPIRFEPSELDFAEQPLGLPVLRKVRVQNLNGQSSIQMLSISGNTIHFHCSFFADKVIPPSGNTTFDVVFLGREEGAVENTLYIHTSAGSFRFVVRATGTANPYRLKPLVGVRMPLNSSYSPLIELHNPHPEPIQVLEMYSSGGDLHLELPTGETEGPQTLWKIPPFQTKSVMKANFVARMENNHTAYIRIKTNTTGAEFLYLPLEVEVSSAPGLYCPQEMIDFGLLPAEISAGSGALAADVPRVAVLADRQSAQSAGGGGGGGRQRTLKLLLLNSGSKPIPIQNVIATPVTEAMTVDFTPIKVPPDTLTPTVIAEVTFDPALSPTEGLHTGKIVIKSKNSQFKVTLPYRAHVLHGSLEVNDRCTHFHLVRPDDEAEMAEPADKSAAALPLERRNVTLTNTFSVPVAVHRIGLPPEALEYFRLEDFRPPVILRPGQTAAVAALALKEEAWKERTLDSVLTLHTNISSMDVPLVCFHGRLDTFFPGSPSQSLLNFGTLGMGEKRDLYFAVLNRNPVGVTLRSWGCDLTGSLVELMGVSAGNETQILQRAANFSDLPRRLHLPPGYYMVFRIGIVTRDIEGRTEGQVFVDTDYHVFRVGFAFTVARGSLHTVPRELMFDPVFPGQRVDLKLKVYSSFAQEMSTDAVTTVPPDPRFTFKLDNRGGAKIYSGQKSLVGKVTFDPGAECRKEDTCYAGFPTSSKVGREWLQGLGLPDSVSDSDVSLLRTLYSRLRQAVTPSSAFNITLNLDTDQVRGFLFKARANLVWPRVVVSSSASQKPAGAGVAPPPGGGAGESANQSASSDDERQPPDLVRFPLTQVGNASYRDVTLVNPSRLDLHVHLVPFRSYPDGQALADALPTRLKTPTNFSSHPAVLDDVFRVYSVADSATKSALLPLPVLADNPDLLHQDTKAFVLKPSQSARVRLRFRPDRPEKFRHALFVRNNLTGVEMVELEAEGATGSLQFAHWKVGDSPEKAVLEFEVQEKHLKDCQVGAKSRYSLPPVLTVRRQLKLINTGPTSVYIRGFSIEGEPCQAHGFSVLNCDPAMVSSSAGVGGVFVSSSGSSGALASGLSLQPDEYREIDIAYTPDFTLSAAAHTLTISSTLAGPDRLLNFTLQATVPYPMLAPCSAVLPRPPWEFYLWCGVNLVMLLAVACVSFAAFWESDRVLKCTLMLPLMQGGQQAPTPQPQSTTSNVPPQGQVFDLRDVQNQVNQELRQRVVTTSSTAASTQQAAALNRGNSSSNGAKPGESKKGPKKLLATPTNNEGTNTHHHQQQLLQLSSRGRKLAQPSRVWPNWLPRPDTLVLSAWAWFKAQLPELRQQQQQQQREGGGSAATTLDTPTESSSKSSPSANAAPTATAEPSKGRGKSAAAATATNAKSPPTPVNQSRKAKRKQQQQKKQPLSKTTSSGSNYEYLETSSTGSSNVEEEAVAISGGSRGVTDHDLISNLPQHEQQHGSNNTNAAPTAAPAQQGSGAGASGGKKGKNKNKNKQNKSATTTVVDEEQLSKKSTEKPLKTNSNNNNNGKSQKSEATAAAKLEASKKSQANAKSKQDEGKVSSSSNGKKTLNGPEKQQAKVKPSSSLPPSVSSSGSATNATTSGTFDKPPRMLQRAASEAEKEKDGGKAKSGELSRSTNSLVGPPAGRQKTKVPPVGKILPEPKRQENLGAQFGPVGAKLPVVAPRKSTWIDSPAEARQGGLFGQLPLQVAPSVAPPPATTTVTASQSSAPHPEKPTSDRAGPAPSPMPFQQQQGHGQLGRATPTSMMDQPQQPQQPASSSAFASASSSPVATATPSYNMGPAGGQQGSPSRSLMQALQAERRQRTEEYLRQRTDWPGFEQQRDYLGDLWDRPQLPNSDLMGGGIGNAANGNIGHGNRQWGNEIWPSANWGMMSLEAQQQQQLQQQQLHQQQQLQIQQQLLLQQQQQQQQQHLQLAAMNETSLGFNPLSFSNIWGSPNKEQQQQQQQPQQQQQQQPPPPPPPQQPQQPQQPLQQQPEQLIEQDGNGKVWSSTLFRQ